MTHDTLLLLGREGGRTREVFETHAARLERRGVADEVEVALYGHEPVRDLKGNLERLEADRVCALPVTVGHSRATRRDLPGALSYVPGEVTYGEPVGADPAVTGALIDRAAERGDLEGAAVVLVGHGDSGDPGNRRAVEGHAARLRERTGAPEVATAYLVQNPAVECARYNVAGDRLIAVPAFLAGGAATEEHVPDRLELDRGGVEYAAPVGTHRGLTDAIEAGAARARARRSVGPVPAAGGRAPVATDGEGEPR